MRDTQLIIIPRHALNGVNSLRFASGVLHFVTPLRVTLALFGVVAIAESVG